MATLSEQEQARALLQKYLSNECTPAEAALVEKWYTALEDEAAIPSPDEEQILQSVKQVVMQHAQQNAQKRIPGRRFLPQLMRAAIVVGLLCSSFLAGRYYYLRPPAPDQDTVITTGNGIHKTLQLPDGTTVALNAASTLTWSGDFRTRRHVVLHGEAFFTIHEDPLHPFTVDAGNLHTRVLGTSFNIRAYAGEEDPRVAVATGKVQVQAGLPAAPGHTNPFVLQSGDQLEYDSSARHASLKAVNVNTISAWRRNALYFEEATIATIAQELERQYGIKIIVTGSSNHTCRYTLHFDHAGLQKVLQVLSQLSGVNYQIINHTIFINTLNCN